MSAQTNQGLMRLSMSMQNTKPTIVKAQPTIFNN